MQCTIDVMPPEGSEDTATVDDPDVSAPNTEPAVKVDPHRVPPPLPGQAGDLRVIESLDRHACPKCGGKAEWNPGKEMLCCPYCGTEFQLEGPPPLPNAVEERDLLAELGRLDEESGEWVKSTRRVQCRNCNAVIVRSTETVSQRCDFCGSPEMLDYDDIGSVIKPWGVLPGRISQEDAYHRVKEFLGRRWFAPNDLKRRNMMDRFHRVYLPYWTFDAEVSCPWTADSGTYYYTTESYKDSQGNRRTRQVRHTRWRPASGQIHTSFDDVTVKGSQGVTDNLLPKVEPFPTTEVVPYETRYISGWQVEHYQVSLPDAASTGRGLMNEMLRGMCARDVPGDTFRNLRIYPEYSAQTFKHILVPVWIASYQYRGKTWQALVNAYTGSAAAKFPISYWKVAGVTLLILLIVAIFMILSSQ